MPALPLRWVLLLAWRNKEEEERKERKIVFKGKLDLK